MIRQSHSLPEAPPALASRHESPLPPDFFRALHVMTAGQGERHLALGVLENAVRCIERGRGAVGFVPRLHSWEAERWIESREHELLFSFESICAILGIDAGRIRGQIRRWRGRTAALGPGFIGSRPRRTRRSSLSLVPAKTRHPRGVSASANRES